VAQATLQGSSSLVIDGTIAQTPSPNHRIMTTLPRLLLGICSLIGLATFTSAQMVPPPTDQVFGTGDLCTARTNGVTSPNPYILTETSGAVMEEGGTWEATLEVSGRNSGLAVLLVSARAARINLGGTRRLLVDTSQLILREVRMHDGNTPIQYSMPVPTDPALCGLDGWVQAVVTGGPSFELSNGLHVYVGE
jgi:hypothetical protein